MRICVYVMLAHPRLGIGIILYTIVPEIIAGIKHCNLRVSLITYASPAQPARSRRSRSLHGPRARTLHARPVALPARARCMRAHVASGPGPGNVHVASAGLIAYRLRP